VVANAWKPFARVGYPVIATYLAGVLPAELPLPTAAAVLVPTVVAARRGALRSGPGRLGLALTGASLGTLLALDWSARRDHRVLERALIDALGPSYRARMASLAVPEPSLTARYRHPLPRTGRRSPLKAARDIPYGPAGKRNLLDVWRHPNLPANAGAPVLVQIHGGAWMTGSKYLQGVPMLTYLASRGWVGVAINYRVSPRATWPDHLVDVKRALTWVKANIADHGGDPGFITVTGGSAGGHLSALAALTHGDPQFQPGFEDADTRVQAAVPLYGAYDITDLEGTGRRDAIDFWERHVMKAPYNGDEGAWVGTSPVLTVRSDAPPMFIVHGREDALVRVEGARLFVRRLRDAGAPLVAYAELPHARHAFDVFDTARTRATVAAAERFLLVAFAAYLEADRGR
jgi:acetyl esterase/lipase